ncbi:MAG: amidohydrolase [Ilumatobacter sp.]
MITMYTAATIVTMNERCPTADAVAVRDDRIVAVGSLDEVIAALGDAAYEVDESLADRVLLPGLIDQHLHPILGATTLATDVIATEDWVLPDRTYPAANSHEEYVQRLTEADERMGVDAEPDDWLFSWGYHELWHGELNREILDAVSNTRPIGVWQRSCHEFYLNTPALRAVGLLDRDLGAEVEAGTLDAGVAETASIERGHFWERGNFVLVFPLVTPMLFAPERFARGLNQMVRYLHQNGVTAFNEPGAILVPGAWELYEQILGHEDTPFYSFFLTDGRGPAEQAMSHEATLERAERQLAMAPDGKLRFFDKQVKLFADGAIISQLMQMEDPYLDRDGNPNPDHHGAWLMEPDVFDERAKLYWDHGFQLHIHVNGDAGLEMVLDTIERRMAQNPRPDHRTVIVHFANSTEAQIDRIARLGCVVSSNPYYPVGFADKFGEVGLGPARADVMTRHRSVLDRRIPLSFHSDLPMGRSDPIGMMSCAVNRVTPSGRIAGPEQRITAAEALRAVTIDAAQSWRQEHELGSIEPGKIANFTVVDRNPLDVEPEALDGVSVVGTFFEGRWFPVPDAASSRVSDVAARGPGAFAASSAQGDHEHSGCVCDVARHLERALRRHLAA